MKLILVYICISFTFIGNVLGQFSNLESNLHVKPNTNGSLNESSESWALESFGDRIQASEVLALRDQNAKHFQNQDGSFTAFIAAGNLHFWEDNRWKTIFHRIQPTANGFQNLDNSHKTYYPNLSSGSLLTRLSDGTEIKDMIDMRMFFQVNGQQVNVQNIAGTQGGVNFNELTYSNVFGTGIDLRLTQQTTKRKMDYILSNINALGSIPLGANFLVFEEKIQLPIGWTAMLDGNTIVIINNNGDLKLVYEKPMFKDAPQQDGDGHWHSDELEGEYSISQTGTFVTICTKVDVNWLSASDRIFPVVIDPTVNLYPDNLNLWTGRAVAYHANGSSAADAPLYTTSTLDNTLNDVLRIGRTTTNYSYQSWAKFNISSLPSNCINSVNLNYRVSSNFSNSSDCYATARLRHLASDPVTNTAAGRLADIRDGDIYEVREFRCFTTGAGWVNAPMTANLDELESAIPSGWFGVGIHTFQGGSHTTCYTEVFGYSNVSRPYLTVDYTPNYLVQFSNATPTTLCAGQTKDISVTITNNGCLPWTSGWSSPNSVNFSWWGSWQAGGLAGGQDNNPRQLPFVSLAPGASQVVTFSVTAPAAPGAYSIQTDLVRDGVCWFRGNGAPSCGPGNVNFIIPITVAPSAASPTSVSASLPSHPNYCHGNTINLTSVGGTAASGTVIDVWYENSCNLGFEETWATTPVGRPGWWIGSTTVNSASGILNVTSTGTDPMIYIGNLSINPNIYRYVQVRYRYVSGPANPNMQVFFENGLGLAESRSQKGIMVLDGAWHYMNLDMSLNFSNVSSGWTGGPNITGFRFDFAEASGMVLEYDFFLVSQDRMVGDQTTLTLPPSSPYYPTVSTQYYTRKIDNCGATSCASASVILPPLGTTLANNSESATCYVNANETIRYYHSSGRYIASVTAGATTLGSTIATNYLEPGYLIVPACDLPSLNLAVMQRHWVITPTTNGPATVRLPYYLSELANLGTGSIISSSGYDLIVSPTNSNVVLSKYSGGAFPASTNVNSSPFDNCTVGGTTLYNNIAVGANTPVASINAMYSDFSIPGFSEFWLHGNSNSSPLPITLSSFTAMCNEAGDEVNVQWTTSSENNTSHFNVERSVDGTNWELLGTTGAAGNSAISLTYEMKDKEVRGYDIIYYRLKQYDIDGVTETFGLATAQCLTDRKGLELFPNPAESEVTVILHGEYDMETTQIIFSDMNGKEVKRVEYDDQTSKMIKVDLKDLKHGVYIVKLIDGESNNQFVRLVIN